MRTKLMRIRREAPWDQPGWLESPKPAMVARWRRLRRRVVRVYVPSRANVSHPCTCQRIWLVHPDTLAKFATKRKREAVTRGEMVWADVYVCAHAVAPIRSKASR